MMVWTLKNQSAWMPAMPLKKKERFCCQQCPTSSALESIHKNQSSLGFPLIGISKQHQESDSIRSQFLSILVILDEFMDAMMDSGRIPSGHFGVDGATKQLDDPNNLTTLCQSGHIEAKFIHSRPVLTSHCLGSSPNKHMPCTDIQSICRLTHD